MKGNNTLLLLFFSLFILSHGTLMTRYNLTDISPLAVCNDGSPAVYYFSPGSGAGINTWVIRMMGGGWCYDLESCKRRESEPQLISSKGCTEQYNVDGILSANPEDNPNFYNANRVYLWYCSSDSHLGTKKANETITGWHYQGKEGVRALIYSLLNNTAPSIRDAKQVLVTGDSAGGVGAMNNADFIYDLLHPIIPDVHFRVFVDAGFFLDIPAYGINNNFSFQMIAKNLFDLWGAVYDESCMEYYGHGNEWHCFHGQYAWPHLQTLAFYQEFEFDHANLDFDAIKYPFNSEMQNYTNYFQKSMLSNMAKVPYFFLPNCYKHQTIDSTLFVSIKIGETSIAQAMWNWFIDYSSSPSLSQHIDGCSNFNCNPTCPPPS